MKPFLYALLEWLNESSRIGPARWLVIVLAACVLRAGYLFWVAPPHPSPPPRPSRNEVPHFKRGAS